MGVEEQFEREENILEAQLADGEITLKQYNTEMRELQRDMAQIMNEENESHYGLHL